MLNLKLNALKQNLKVWNWEVSGDLNLRKSSLLHELSSLDGLEGGNFNERGKRES